jgi:hypothetical protein
MRKTWPVAFGLLILIPGLASAQGSGKLALLIPELFGPDGLKVDSQARLPDGSTHSAHFNSAFQSQFTQFNIALASQLAAIPMPSPASGFTYTFDETLGVYQRSTQSFGPILVERPETLGKGKLSFGVSYQYYSFDSLEGLDLGAVPAVFTHDDAQLGGGRSDVVTTLTGIDTSVNQMVLSLSYGLGGRLDLSLAVPFVSASLDAHSTAEIERVGTTNPAIHFYGKGGGDYGTSAVYSDSGQASGIGDLVLRLKGHAVRGDRLGVALGLDLRLPTGDEEDLLGLGTLGLRPFAALAFSHGRVAPHLNVGYQWNGESVLAGDVATGHKEEMPDQVTYAGGLDIGVTKRLTLALDVVGAYVIDSPRLVQQTFTTAGGTSYPQIGFVTESYGIANGSAGVKINLFGRMLLDVNVLFKLNNSGLRDKVTPLVGLEYAF